jgi:predicted NBD/HSP70 family sugar kinase
MEQRGPARRTPIREVRRRHRQLVLRALRDSGPLPRADLARRLGLSATTMTKVVGELIAEGVVAESGVAGPGLRVGRPATHVRIMPESRTVLGVGVGAGLVQLAVCDLYATPLRTLSFRYEPTTTAEEVVDRIGQAARSLVAHAGAVAGQPLGIGVAAPGPVDDALRRNLLSINLGWRDVAFSDRLEAAVHLPTVVDHNVRTMALAEARYGPSAADPLLYVYVRTGVGAGLVIDGVPFRAGPYGVTELGHLQVLPGGPVCACGARGCLETLVAEPVLTRQATALLGHAPRALLPQLVQAADDGHDGAQRVLAAMVDHLTTGLASAVNLFNPERVVLGGMFEGAPAPLLDTIATALYGKAFPLLRDRVRIAPSSLGPLAGAVGGAALALDHFFYT